VGRFTIKLNFKRSITDTAAGAVSLTGVTRRTPSTTQNGLNVTNKFVRDGHHPHRRDTAWTFTVAMMPQRHAAVDAPEAGQERRVQFPSEISTKETRGRNKGQYSQQVSTTLFVERGRAQRCRNGPENWALSPLSFKPSGGGGARRPSPPSPSEGDIWWS